MNTWEIVLFLAARQKAYQEIFLPLKKGQNPERIKSFFSEQFGILSTRADWRFIEAGSHRGNRGEFQKSRDESIIGAADVYYPVSLRPDGNLDRLLKAKSLRGKTAIDSFRLTDAPSRKSCKITLDPKELNPNIDRVLENCLIHWTRACNGPWPGEKASDYYKAVIDSDSKYPRDGLETLKRILEEKRLRASPRHYRKNLSVVAFSALKPSEAIRLMKWRARYRQMTFEPYGVAIQKEYALQLGVREVLYGSAEMFDCLGKEEQPYFQNIGKIGYWKPENEYRHLGDVELQSLPDDVLFAVVWKKEEAASLQTISDKRIVTMYRG
jgi:hypothetical protein